MIIGSPKETKAGEKGVSLLPVGAHVLVEAVHSGYVEQGVQRMGPGADRGVVNGLPVG